LVRLAPLLVLSLALAGCGLFSEAQPELARTPSFSPTPKPTPTPAPSPTPAPTPTPGPTPGPQPTFPLTGLPADDEAALSRPVLAAKIDNVGAARPQVGLRFADVVMVELVERATRFVALFHSTDPGRFGPVRSGRFADAALLPPFEPVMALSGAARPVLARLRSAGLALYGEGSTEGWSIICEVPAAHNLLARAQPLWRAGQQAGLPPAEGAWTFDSDEPRGARVAERADLVYPNAGSVTWQFHHRTGRWRRSQDGGAHRVASGAQVDADNVVIVRVPARGDVTRPFEPLAAGDLVVLRGRRRVEGTWHKPSAEAHFAWRDVVGDPLPLLPGRTWIELVPTSGRVAVR
jgi:hypothetical protein